MIGAESYTWADLPCGVAGQHECMMQVGLSSLYGANEKQPRVQLFLWHANLKPDSVSACYVGKLARRWMQM